MWGSSSHFRDVTLGLSSVHQKSTWGSGEEGSGDASPSCSSWQTEAQGHPGSMNKRDQKSLLVLSLATSSAFVRLSALQPLTWGLSTYPKAYYGIIKLFSLKSILLAFSPVC